MKSLLLIISTLIIATICFSNTSNNFNYQIKKISKDKIIGIWQRYDITEADGWTNNIYVFYKDNKFIYHINDYDYTTRIRNFGRIYNLSQDTIFLKSNTLMKLLVMKLSETQFMESGLLREEI